MYIYIHIYIYICPFTTKTQPITLPFQPQNPLLVPHTFGWLAPHGSHPEPPGEMQRSQASNVAYITYLKNRRY